VSAGTQPIEGAGPVRDEDAFDVDAVVAWLREQGERIDGEIEVRQFAGGASNLTYSLRSTGRADQPGTARDLILRRPPTGRKARGAHDMGREYRIQAALEKPFGLVATMVAFCDDPAVLGSDFYVMERIDGLIPRRDFPVPMSAEQVRRVCTNALDTLIALHRVDVTDPALTALGKGTGYVARQVAGWSTRYRNALTDDAADGESVMSWLDEHQPEDVGSCLIHNDFRFDNLVLDRDDPTRVRGVLDWEMATLGDPLMDLGGTLSYWVQPDDDEFFLQFRRQPTTAPGMLTRAEVVDYYCAATGHTVTPEQWRFYEVYGLFRLAVIAQQIYYRYFHGQTHNEAYAIFGPAAQYLLQRSRQVIGG
jgi:aminoglycoside phosphotransferase (APT) family kinase protein